MSKERDKFFEKMRELAFPDIEFFQKYPYTVCMVTHDGYSGIGFSKANPIDEWNPLMGKGIAQGRAIADIWRQKTTGWETVSVRIDTGSLFVGETERKEG